MYSLLTGHPPMQGQDLPETLSNVLSLKTPPPPDHFRTELSPQLRNVVMKCLRKEPAERFATAEELLKELKGLDLSE